MAARTSCIVRLTGRLRRVALVGMVAAGLAGCSVIDPQPSSAPLPSAAPGKTAAHGRSSSIVGSVAFSRSDVASLRLGVRLIPHGAGLKQPTLDNCGDHFPTEAHRVARRQVGLLVHGRQTGVSNEVVTYDSPRQAVKALAELRRSVTSCPRDRFETDALPHQPKLRYDRSVVRTAPGLPARHNLVVREQVTAKSPGRHTYVLHVLEVLQVGGSTLDAVYLLSPTPPTRADIAVFNALAQMAGRKVTRAAVPG